MSWRDGLVREVLGELMQWWEAGETIGVGTVVATFRSAPRPPGASMLVGPDQSAVGSVSGGCIEGAVVSEAMEVMQNGKPKVLEYGVTNELAWEIGLACGGTIQVFVEKVE